MARIFLDANAFIDLVTSRTINQLKQLSGHELFISPLSIHIFLYVFKVKVPSKIIGNLLRYLSLISLTDGIVAKALIGPTTDFEDNVQLHSAASVDCDFLLTSDRKLLKTKFFGKTQITSALPS